MILRLISTYFRPHSALLALICVLLLPSFASGADRCGSFDRIMIALRLTKTLYPELMDKELSVAFSVGYPSAWGKFAPIPVHQPDRSAFGD